MATKRGDLAAYIAETATTQHDPKALAKAIAAYLLETKQVGQLESLLRDVMAIREQHGFVEANVTASHDITSGMVDDIKELLRAKKPNAKSVAVNSSQDSETIGGLKIRLAHQQLDMTVRAKLDTFKRLTAEGTN